MNSPGSADAIGYLASKQMSSVGPGVAIVTLQEFALQNPEYGYLRLRELTMSCGEAPARNHLEIVRFLETTLPEVLFAPEVGPMLDQLLDASHGTDCNDVDSAVVRSLVLSVHKNPRYSGNQKHSSIHHQLLAKLSRKNGDIDEAIRQDYAGRTAAVREYAGA